MSKVRPTKWRKLSSKKVYANPWYHVTRDQVIRPDGTRGEYSVVHTNGRYSVYIVPINHRGQTLLLKKHRYPTNSWNWEVPAGGVSKGERPLRAAQRELLEEAGLRAAQWTRIGKVQAMVGISSEWMQIYIARDLEHTKAIGVVQEAIVDSRWASFSQVTRMIQRGTINDSQTIAALTLAAQQPRLPS